MFPQDHRPTSQPRFGHQQIVLLDQMPFDCLLVFVFVQTNVTKESSRLLFKRETLLACVGCQIVRSELQRVVFFAQMSLNCLLVLVSVPAKVAMKNASCWISGEFLLNLLSIR